MTKSSRKLGFGLDDIWKERATTRSTIGEEVREAIRRVLDGPQPRSAEILKELFLLECD